MTEANTQNNPQLEVLRIYVKDLSLEVPSAPAIFQKDYRPEISVDLNITHSYLENQVYEVVLTVTVTATIEEKTVFLTEVKQAGIFQITGFPAEQLDHILEAYVPTVLFPYAREAISNLVTKASFPPVILAPMNFDAIYRQKKTTVN
ncbi:MAG: protein-export chaperone SecB [Gammaproteobacteria bacterium GWE2_42_36]|nr:MAG: protein-export chaperone SecB [Gammaproteobacteria bacterium GWE2_42_36]HCU05582.1 protein-export chaperone SecB [Coxiellaceae bacterium]